MLRELQRASSEKTYASRYGFAILFSAAAVGLSYLLRDRVSATLYIFCFVAVSLASAYGGIGPGLLSTTICVLGIDFFLTPPLYQISFAGNDWLGASMFTLVSIFISSLAESKRRLQQDLLAITDSVPAGIAYIDRELKYRFGNATYAARFSQTPESIYGMPVNKVVGADLYLQMLPHMNRALEGESVHFEAEAVDPQGTPLTIDAHFVPAAPLRRGIPGFYVLSTDITQRKQMEMSLRASEEKYRLASNAGQVGLWDWDIAANRVSWSEKIYQFHGLQPGEFDGTVEGFTQLIHPDDRAGVQATLDRALERGGRYRVDFRALWADGTVRWLAAEAEVIRQDGRAVRMIGATIDVTDRKRTEEALRASEQHLKMAMSAARMGVFEYDPVHDVGMGDHEIRRIFGFGPDEPIRFEEAIRRIVGRDREKVATAFRRAMEPGSDGLYQAEYRVHPAGGQLTWVASRGLTFFEGEGTARRPVRVVGVVIDISDRMRAEDRQRRAIEAGHVGLWEWDMVNNQVVWSDQVYALYGLRRGEFRGTVEHFGAMIHPEDRERVMTHLQEAVAGRAAYNTELRIQRPDGDIRWIWTTGDIERDITGRPVQMVGTVIDITDRKRSEQSLAQLNENLEKEVAARLDQLRKKEQELFQVRKLEAIGQLAGGVAHDFNNLMTGILAITESLHESLPLDDPRREDTEAVIQASQRTAELTRQLLAFGRRQIANTRVIDLNDAVRDITALLKRLIRENIQFQLRLGDAGHIKMDATQLQQILINLVLNARDAMPEGGRLTIQTDRENDRARIVVSDTGVGMSLEVQSHLFEPFYTTKEPTKGTGLGLATVYGIVKQHQGDIEVASQPGAGTTFTLYFPSAKPEKTDPVISPAQSNGHGGETVLLVEDEDIVRHVIAKKLRAQGYQVLVASHGRQAVDLARQQPLDLIVTDVIMPDLNGPEVVTQVRQIHPKIAVLYMSGYPEDVIAHSGVLEPGIDFLEKPVVAQQIAQKAREVLDKSRVFAKT